MFYPANILLKQATTAGPLAKQLRRFFAPGEITSRVNSRSTRLEVPGDWKNNTWKNNQDQACSCPRDWCLSVSMGAQFRSCLKDSVYHDTVVLRGLRRALNWATIMLRGARLEKQLRSGV